MVGIQERWSRCALLPDAIAPGHGLTRDTVNGVQSWDWISFSLCVGKQWAWVDSWQETC
jgi:hypothetical protein